MATPAPARGAVMPALVPRQFRYIFRVAELTIATGLLNLFASGRGQELTRLDTRWSWAILAGIVLAVGIYAATRATVFMSSSTDRSSLPSYPPEATKRSLKSSRRVTRSARR